MLGHYHPSRLDLPQELGLASSGSLLPLMLSPGMARGYRKTPKPPTELEASSSHSSHPNAICLFLQLIL